MSLRSLETYIHTHTNNPLYFPDRNIVMKEQWQIWATGEQIEECSLSVRCVMTAQHAAQGL